MHNYGSDTIELPAIDRTTTTCTDVVLSGKTHSFHCMHLIKQPLDEHNTDAKVTVLKLDLLHTGKTNGPHLSHLVVPLGQVGQVDQMAPVSQ